MTDTPTREMVGMLATCRQDLGAAPAARTRERVAAVAPGGGHEGPDESHR